MSAAMAPPQPLPTRGRDFLGATANHDRNRSTAAWVVFRHRILPQLSPSPLWGGVGEGSATVHVHDNKRRPCAGPAPLCPAGHLPHGWRDRLGAAARHLPISPLAGEMSGRTERGNAGAGLVEIAPAAPPHPTLRATFSPPGRRGDRRNAATSPFSPTGRRCRQADEGGISGTKARKSAATPNTERAA